LRHFLRFDADLETEPKSVPEEVSAWLKADISKWEEMIDDAKIPKL
jgi:hypothetical protein